MKVYTKETCILFSCYNLFKGDGFMPRVRKEKNRSWSKEEKLRIINLNLKSGLALRTIAKEEDISIGMLARWISNYLKFGEDSLINKRKPGNPLMKYSSKKQLTKEEQLEYENMKLRIENEMLKKGFLMKEDGSYVKFMK